MNITRKSLDEAVSAGILSSADAARLWDFLGWKTQDQAGFRFTHILYYFGGLLAIGAMTLFVTLGWEAFGGWGLFGIAFAYGTGGILLTRYFLNEKHLRVPAGLSAAFVVALTPLAVYGLQKGLGFWPTDEMAYRDFHTLIDWRWIVMELSTLACGAILLYIYRLPFMLMPIAVTLWYMSMDLTPFLFGDSDMSWALRKFVSVFVGAVMLLIAFWIDVRTRRDPDFAFWLYVFGTIAFWGGLSTMNSDNEFNKLIYMLVNVGMILLGAALARRVFVVFGGLGVMGYLGHLAYGLFKDSLMFPLALTIIGFFIICLGIVWQKHEASIGRSLRANLPAALREMVEN